MILRDGFSPRALARLVAEERVRGLLTVPSLYAQLLALEPEQHLRGRADTREEGAHGDHLGLEQEGLAASPVLDAPATIRAAQAYLIRCGPLQI